MRYFLNFRLAVKEYLCGLAQIYSEARAVKRACRLRDFATRISLKPLNLKPSAYPPPPKKTAHTSASLLRPVFTAISRKFAVYCRFKAWLKYATLLRKERECLVVFTPNSAFCIYCRFSLLIPRRRSSAPIRKFIPPVCLKIWVNFMIFLLKSRLYDF